MEVDDICRYLKPFLGEKADRMWQAYQVADFEGRKQIEQYLRILSLQYLQATPDQSPAMFLPPPAETLDGDYPVGHVILQEKTFGTFAIREDEWLQHVAILGRSGSTLPAMGGGLFTDSTPEWVQSVP